MIILEKTILRNIFMLITNLIRSALTFKKINFLFLLILFSFSSLFVVLTSYRAQSKEFWYDEQYVLERIGKDSYSSLMIHGPQGQFSAAPLDYIVLKVLDDIKEPLRSFNLPDTIYFRLHTIFYTLISGLIVIWLAFLRIRKQHNDVFMLFCQASLLTLALIQYYFKPVNFYFSIETRSYSLWNALWFLAASLVLIKGCFKWYVVALLMAMAATMTGSIFQIFSLGVSFLCVNLFINRIKERSFGDVVWEGVKVFAFPTLIVAYYIFSAFSFVGPFHDPQQFWPPFFLFWLAHLKVPAVSAIAIYMAWKKKHVGALIVFVAIAVLFFIAPVHMWLTFQHGIYFAPRHFNHYDLIYPLFLIFLALILPKYLKINLK